MQKKDSTVSDKINDESIGKSSPLTLDSNLLIES